MKKSDSIAAAVLAGGLNSRMRGRNKAFINIGGVPIIKKTIETLEDIFEEIIIVTNSTQEFACFKKGIIVVEDIIKGVGPLGGIHCALTHTTKGAVFFVACDMPFLHNELIRQQLEYFKSEDCKAFVPKINDFIEPLHAIYKKDLADTIYCFVEKNGNFSIKSFLKTVDVYYWNLEDSLFHRHIFRNINTEEDLAVIPSLFYEDKIEGKVKGLA